MSRKKGIRAEDLRVNQLSCDYDVAFRAAGSHSPCDCVAFDGDEVVFEQIKSVKFEIYEVAKQYHSSSYLYNKNGLVRADFQKEISKFIKMPVPISVTKRFMVRVGQDPNFVCLWER